MRRMLGLAMAAAVGVPLCSAQTGWIPGFSRSMSAVKRQGRLPEKKQGIGEPFKLIHADKGSVVGDDVSASGAVHATYKGYEIFADKLTGNRKTKVFRLEGNGRLVGQTETVEGAVVIVDFGNDTFAFEDGKARIKPERLEKRLVGDVFVKAGSGAGTQADFTTEHGSFTTCDLDPAHFELDYDTSRIIPGKRAELRSVRLSILGKTVLGLPMVVIPLNRRGPKTWPEVGQSVDEGYYIKTRVSTPLHGNDYVDTRLDYMTKLGAGLGLDYNYLSKTVNGKLSAYTITGGSKSKVFSAQHNQKLGRADWTLSSNYQLSDYLTAPSSTLWSTSSQLLVPWGSGNTRLGFNRFFSESSGFKSESQNISIGDDRRFGGVSSRIDLNLAKSVSSGFGTDVRSQRLDVKYGASASFRSFDAELTYQRGVPIGSTANFYDASDVTPMLTLRSTGRQLFSDGFGERWPFSLEASIGELVNPSTTGSERVTRINLEAGIRRSEGSPKHWSLNWGGRFKQGLYSDDTAQYVLNYDSNLAYHFSGNSSVSLTYNNLRAFGFTPLSIDSTGRSDSFSFDLNYNPTKALKLSLQTGYDVLQGDQGEVPWQFVWFRSRWNPGKWLDVNGTASYDTFNQAWSNFRVDAGATLGDTRMFLGARYDGLRSQWAGFNVFVDGFRVGRVTSRFLLDYDGYMKQLVAQHYQFAYDLHCAEAVFEVIDNQVGFRSGRTLAFYIRLKAFPGGSPFGYGTRGGSIGGGYGFGN
ncbi:MAG: LPS-assembly protein LptD [Armatimonadetes bacterium]|nr:LPS-assembly protein LptD [Armatimonadota bacterium]